MRIDKLLANSGFGSRKEVKKLLKTGAVKINGTTVKDPQTHLDPERDQVTVHGETVEYKEFIYLMMNKPQGVISSTEDDYDETVIDLLEMEDKILNPFPVGRLDKDTVGLLLLTNDGQLAHQLLSPKKHVPKTYYAKISGIVTNDDIEAFKRGVTLDDGYVTKPAELVILSINEAENKSEIELTITEGKFHQVKRMFAAVGKKVTFLMRIKMGSLMLDESLKPGEYRELSEEEISVLKQT
ncbi:pseudouridine synthase [Calidifontibacillus erzurumensis]|uniref:Pseudouridine synthase n=1 Tax=Calidifontibacillus erzurumensis TaxID=2741433 RepID=A0A8J8GDV5_9BACI|nr:pseudouridine synthase [Calidifontibacillus erzurumensis]NSL51341.1 rRNA pseudouridine synthase [Calidifontibacillus erzurumensis]